MLRKLGNIRVSLLLCLVVVAAIETPGAAATDGISPAVTAAIKDPGRPPEEIQSDKARKPAETLDRKSTRLNSSHT